MKKRIHIFGASGSGTSSIARAVCAKIGYKHFDSDNYLWLPTEKPFSTIRPPKEFIDLMGKDLTNNERWILSGHVSFGMSDVYLSLYELVVFVCVPPEIRMGRLKKREYERYGEEIYVGGNRHEASEEFLIYAASYDAGTGSRSLQAHEKWLTTVKCPILRITNDCLDESVQKLISAL